MKPKAILVNLSNVVAPVMEAHGRANLAALQVLVSKTGMPMDTLVHEMRTTPLPDEAYLPGHAPAAGSGRPTLFENNTFYGPDWIAHLPSVQNYIRQHGEPHDMVEATKTMLREAIDAHQKALRDNMTLFRDFVEFHGRVKEADPDCKFIAIPDVKADYTTTILNIAEINDGTFRNGLDFFDHVIAPPANPLEHKLSRCGTGHWVTVLPKDVRKPSPDYVEFVTRTAGIAPEDWLVIGEKADKDGMIVGGTAEPGAHFVQIKRRSGVAGGTDLIKQLSNYGARAAADVEQAHVAAVTPSLVVESFMDERLLQKLELAVQPEAAPPQPESPQP